MLHQKWYWLAKTLAEEAAWKYAEQNGIQLLSINPGFVIGPLLHPTLNTSSYFILELLKGYYYHLLHQITVILLSKRGIGEILI